MHIHEKIKLEHGITVKIVLDELECDSPLQDDDAVKMVVLHNRYIDPAKGECGRTPEEVSQWIRSNKKQWEIFDLYMYDHSGTAYSIAPFSCPWDSGKVGILALKKSDFPKKTRTQSAKSICESYTSWANGEVYGYIIEDADGEELESCWGFIGDPDDYCKIDALDNAAYFEKEAAEKEAAEFAEQVQNERPDLAPAWG